MIVNTYERSYEGEGLAIGGQYGWVDDATRWQEECETYQRQPKQGGDDGYHQLHPRAVVSFHRRLKLEQRSFGTREAQLEQASAPGTPSGLLEQPIGLLERAKRYWLITVTLGAASIRAASLGAATRRSLRARS